MRVYNRALSAAEIVGRQGHAGQSLAHLPVPPLPIPPPPEPIPPLDAADAEAAAADTTPPSVPQGLT